MARDEVKRQAIRDLLAEYDEDTYPGDRAIADELGVSNHLVYAVRTGHRRGADPVPDPEYDPYFADDPAPGSWRDWLPVIGVGAVVLLILVGIVVIIRRSPAPAV